MSEFQFDKSLRLLNSSDYKAVFDDAKLKVSNQHLLFLARFNHQAYPRLGLIIAKKNVRLAVQRNRVKRAIRETFRLRQDELAGLDIIVLARKGLADLDKPALNKTLNQLWQQLQYRAEKKKRQSSNL